MHIKTPDGELPRVAKGLTLNIINAKQAGVGMWLANLVARVPFTVRLVITVVVLLGLFLLSGPVILNHVGFFLVVILLLFFDRIIARTEKKVEYVADPVAVISLEDNYLVVNHHRIKASDITRLALGDDGKHGYLQFPFNPKFDARLSFPRDQIAPLSMHLKKLLPDITLVE